MSSTGTASTTPMKSRTLEAARKKDSPAVIAKTTGATTDSLSKQQSPAQMDQQTKPEKPILSGAIEKRGLDGDWKSRFGVLTKRKLELFADEKMGRVYVKIHFRAEDSAFRLRIDQVRMPNQFVLSVIEPHKPSSAGPSSTPTVVKKDHMFRLRNEVELRLWFSKIKQVIDRADAAKHRHKVVPVHRRALSSTQTQMQSAIATTTATTATANQLPPRPNAIPGKDSNSTNSANLASTASAARLPPTSNTVSSSVSYSTSTTTTDSDVRVELEPPSRCPDPPPLIAPSQWSHIITDPPDGSLIYAATMERLVQVLCGDFDHLREPNFEDTFFMTYLSFTTPSAVLAKIIEQFHAIMSEHLDLVVQQSRILRVCIALQTWLRDHADDLDNNSEVLESLNRFIRLIESTLSRFPGREISEALNSVQKLFAEYRRSGSPMASQPLRTGHSEPSPPLTGANFAATVAVCTDAVRTSFEQYGTPTVDITRYNSMELATEMTLIESDLFTALKTKEFLVPQPGEWAIGKEIAERFKKMVNWIQVIITKETSTKRRAGIISKLMDIVGCLKFLKNYNSMFQICTALNSPPIRRLARTWEKIPKHQLDELERLLELFTPCTLGEPFALLADELFHVQPPCVPLFGKYLVRLLHINAQHRDLDFVSVYNKYDRDGSRFRSLVNWQRCRQVALLLFEIRHFQRVRYTTAKSDTSLRWLLTDRIFQLSAGIDDAQLLRLSCHLEPPPADEILLIPQATTVPLLAAQPTQSSVVLAARRAGADSGSSSSRSAMSPFRSTHEEAAGPPPQISRPRSNRVPVSSSE